MDIGQLARASANRRRSPRGKRARGRRRGHRRHGPKRPGGTANVLRWARRDPGQWGHEENQGSAEQHSGGKIQGIQDRTEERRCDQRPAHIPLRKMPPKPPGLLVEKNCLRRRLSSLSREACSSTTPGRSAAAGKDKSGNDTTRCAARTGQNREVEQRVRMVWRPTAAIRAASLGRHWLRKVSNANAFISEVIVF